MNKNATTAAPTYFWSGSNRPGEIKALAKHGQHIGVAVDALDQGGWSLRALLKLVAFKLIKLFIDSGAFGEVELNEPHKCKGNSKKCRAKACVGAGNFPYPNEAPYSWCTKIDDKGRSCFITDAMWIVRLATMKTLAKALGAQCFIVAPDRVGCQVETLARLRRYASQVRELRALGANIIVALQKGELSQADFDLEVTKILGFDDYIRGIPSKKAAATTEEIAALSKALPADARVHLLGLGPWDQKRFAAVIAAIGRPVELVFCDSVRIKAMVGKANGPKVTLPCGKKVAGPRILTKITDAVVEALGLSHKSRLSGKESAVVKFKALDLYFSNHHVAVAA